MGTWESQRRLLQGKAGLTRMEVEERVFGEVETEFVTRLISPLAVASTVSGAHNTKRSPCKYFNFF